MINNYIVDLIYENGIDIIVLAEYNDHEQKINEKIKENISGEE